MSGFPLSTRVKWFYLHHLGSGMVYLSKTGVLLRVVKHSSSYWDDLGALQLAVVRFDGNKCDSRVPLSQLRLAIGTE